MLMVLSDANVAIDLFKINALELFLRSDLFEVHIPDLVIDELNNPGIRDFFENSMIANFISTDLTSREQEIPHLYRWWDELR